MRRRDLTHMQLLTLPINSQDPDPADICHGRNSLVHKATRSAVPVSGRDTAVCIKSGADRDPESSEFIMPGLQVYHCTNSISRHLLPTKALIEDTVFEIRVAKWSSATLGIWKLFCFVVIYVNIWHISMTLSKPFQLRLCRCFSLGRQRIEYLFYVTARKIIQPHSFPVTREYKFVCQRKNNHLQHCYSCTRLLSSLNIESLSSWERTLSQTLEDSFSTVCVKW